MSIKKVHEYFGVIFERTAVWREEKAIEYPDDERNQDAIEELHELRRQAEDIEPEVAEAYWRAYENVDLADRLVEIEQEALRCIGFSSSYSNATEFVDDILSELPLENESVAS